jgi:hypothetical protein
VDLRLPRHTLLKKGISEDAKHSEELLAGGSSRRPNKAIETASESDTWNKNLRAAVQVAVLILVGSGMLARAETFTLDFSVATIGDPNPATATDAQIQSYIQSILGGSAQLNGAEGGGAPCGSSVSDCYGGLYSGHYYYTGDGHVVGPGSSGTNSTSYTLANKDGGSSSTTTGLGTAKVRRPATSICSSH